MGKVKIINMGLIIVFRIPNTIAVISSVSESTNQMESNSLSTNHNAAEFIMKRRRILFKKAPALF